MPEYQPAPFRFDQAVLVHTKVKPTEQICSLGTRPKKHRQFQGINIPSISAIFVNYQCGLARNLASSAIGIIRIDQSKTMTALTHGNTLYGKCHMKRRR
ncbi:MAG: hypothetical protein ACI82I_003223 [Gammaproteobacteria bacterium]